MFQQNPNILVGLRALSEVARPGQRFTCQQIAAWCGVSFQAIHFMEMAALAKARKLAKEVGLVGEDLEEGMKE